MKKTSSQLIKIAKILLSAALPPHFYDIIGEATKNKCAISFSYRSITNNNVKQYTVMPLELKQRRLKKGIYTVLYAQDVNDNNRTKSFIVNKIFKLKIDKKNNKRIRPNLFQKNYIKDTLK